MSVPPIVSTARTLGWVNTRNGKGWRCSHCTKANEYANSTEEQLKNDISAQEKRNSPVPSQHELVEAIERRKQICWKQGTSQDKRRDLLLMDEEFVKCSSILFQLSADACVTCQDNTQIYKCLGHDGSSSCPHNYTVIVRG